MALQRFHILGKMPAIFLFHGGRNLILICDLKRIGDSLRLNSVITPDILVGGMSL